MKWVTRARPKTDRIACPWLIRRFIDPHAEIRYVPADQVLAVAEIEQARSFDAPDAEFTHRGDQCTFEVLIDTFDLGGDPALVRLARIVHAADIAGKLDSDPLGPAGGGGRRSAAAGASPVRLRRPVRLLPTTDPPPQPMTQPHPATPVARPGGDVVPFGQAVRAWFAISLQTFGGPAGQIAVMQRELVEERRWIGPQRFLHALNYCMLLPGPEAQQLAVYIGWLLNGLRGGLVAGVLFVLPGMVALLALSAIYGWPCLGCRSRRWWRPPPRWAGCWAAWPPTP